MRKKIHITVVTLTMALAAAGSCSLQAQTLQEAADATGAAKLKSIEIAGTGRWFQFGQAPNPDSPWPPFDLNNYVADINYDTSSARVQYARSQVVEAGRVRPAPVEQRGIQFVSGSTAWNESSTGNAENAQPAAVEERAAEIWSTPQGFLKAALANKAATKPVDGGIEVEQRGGHFHRHFVLLARHGGVEPMFVRRRMRPHQHRVRFHRIGVPIGRLRNSSHLRHC